MTYNPKIKNTAANKVTIDADINATNINLGVAEDNDDPTNITENPTYQDGLFAFDTQTTVGVAIDRINEVLAKIAPSPAPSLQSLNSNTSGQSQYLADGETSVEPTLLQTSTTDSRSLPAVSLNKEQFDIISDGSVGGNKYRRLGVLSAKSSITLYLNGTVSANYQQAELNYPNFAYDTTKTYSFDVNQDGIIEDVLDQNGGIVTKELDLEPVIKVQFNGADLAEANYTVTHTVTNEPAVFSSGETFTGFRHTVTTVTLPNTLAWLNGHNYVQIKYLDHSGNELKQTSFVDWFYAPQESFAGGGAFEPGSDFDSALSFALPTVPSDDSADYKYISGIKYIKNYAGFTIKVPDNLKIAGYAKESFPKDFGISILTQAPVAGKPRSQANFSLDNVDLVNNEISIGTLNTIMAANSRVLNATIPITVSVNNDLGRTGQKTYNTEETFMFDSFPTTDGAYIFENATTNLLIDDFNHESYRTKQYNADASYVPSVAEPTAWDSTIPLNENINNPNGIDPTYYVHALIYGGHLRHPKSIFSNQVIVQNPSQEFNYSGLVPAVNARAYYYRKLFKQNGANTLLKFEFSGNAVFGPTTDSTKWHFEIQDSDGNWLDACRNNGIQGCAGKGSLLTDTANATTNTSVIEWNTNTSTGVPPSDVYFLIRISIPQSNNQYLSSLKLLSGGQGLN